MNELELNRLRIDLLRRAIDKVTDGNKSAFGRRLGYKDGAFVRQMLSGERPVSEKTIRSIESIAGMSGWFSALYAPSPGKHNSASAEQSNKEQKPGVFADKTLNGSSSIGSNNIKPVLKVQGEYPLISWAAARTWEKKVGEVAAGDAEEWLPSPDLVSERSFYLRVESESMYNPEGEPSFRTGDLILVDPKGDAMSGKLVIVDTDGVSEPTFRQLIIDGGRRYLKALNPSWPRRIAEIEDAARILGVIRSKIVRY